MSLQRITADNHEVFTVETHPSRSYTSSSSGITGAVNLYARRSPMEKEVFPLSMFTGSAFTDSGLESYRLEIVGSNNTNLEGVLSTYMDKVSATQTTLRHGQQLEIFRFNPPFRINKNYQSKVITRTSTMPFYRVAYPSAQYGFSNYHCFNFKTGSVFPTEAVLLYPNPRVVSSEPGSYYGVTGAFSFDFWIKPNQTTDTPTADYRPGTILHLTGAYALSLITGSSRDVNGYPDRYRLLLQLSSSAGLTPSAASPGARIIFSDDNCLEKEKWHHVTVRWGDRYNLGTGSFVVDGTRVGEFALPYSDVGSTGSIDLGSYRNGDPSVLCVGNFYEGTNLSTNALDRFFAQDTATREGLLELNSSTGVFAPTTFAFTHPLSAEVHEIKLFDKYLVDDEIEALYSDGANLSDPNLKLYVPPLFTEESPVRQHLNGTGGIMVTPFQEKNGTTTKPFVPEMAYSVGGMYMSLENFTREFVRGTYPRLWNLTGSVINTTTSEDLSANGFLYATGSNAYRQYLAYPCDNGHFVPNFDMLRTLSPLASLNDLGNYTPGWISLNDMISPFYTSKGIAEEDGVVVEEMFGSSPERVDGGFPNSFAVLHRTRDTSSNQVVLFDISHLFYGQQIKPGSFFLRDSNLSASMNTSISIKDDGNGNLYRADANGPHATWASIGNIFYNEGIVLIKSPQLYFLGENQFEIGFKGTHDIHVSKFSLPAHALLHTSSSNPSYMPVSSSENINETDKQFVYITNIYVHDDNMNVIMKTQMAQPIVKKTGDKIVFKPKMDF